MHTQVVYQLLQFLLPVIAQHPIAQRRVVLQFSEHTRQFRIRSHQRHSARIPTRLTIELDKPALPQAFHQQNRDEHRTNLQQQPPDGRIVGKDLQQQIAQQRLQRGQSHESLQHIPRSHQSQMDNGRESQLAQHQCDVIHQHKHVQHALVPSRHSPVPVRERHQHAIEDHKVPHHHNPLDQPVRLIIITHILKT